MAGWVAVDSPAVIGRLQAVDALDRPDLLGAPVASALRRGALPGPALVAPINADLADTAAFCAAYDVPPAQSANCVVVTGRRDGQARWAAAVILATTRADVNGVLRRRLDVRKLSFARTDAAVTETGMQYGGITPIGLPDGWPILVDAAVANTGFVVVGSGIRGSKLVVRGSDLGGLPQAEVIEGLATPL